MDPLPIDSQIEDILLSLQHSRRQITVVEAAPGAGKTTRLPYAIFKQSWCAGQVLVSEPRRIAARMAAARVAAERRCSLGSTVGYQVRFDDRTGSQTRLIYLTEGLLLRRLFHDPELKGTSVVVLDEAHERSSDLDLLLALLLRALGTRPELRLIIMSATLDAEEWQEYLKNATFFECSGRCFEVSKNYHLREDTRPLAIQVRSGVKTLLSSEGDILVFLPGQKEIRKCASALELLSEVETVVLYGDLPFAEQNRVIMGSRKRKRVILSTSLAESSLTIPGVTAVIDSGLGRQKVFDPWTGVARLETVAISRARCEQRAGRAGRLAPGQVLRLFTIGNYQRRPLQDSPEILREDLSSILLQLTTVGLKSSELRWLSPPPENNWKQATELLHTLGALNADSSLSDTGREMSAISAPPRHARLVVEARRRGLLKEGCLAAALLSERDIVVRFKGRAQGVAPQVVASDSDLDDRIALMSHLHEGGFNRRLAVALSIDLMAAKQVKKVSLALYRMAKSGASEVFLSKSQQPPMKASSLLFCLLAAFPDRVASRRGDSRQLVLCTGTQATLDETSAVLNAALLLVLAADTPGGRLQKPLVRIACRLDTDWLIQNAGARITMTDELFWDTNKERVEEVTGLGYGKVVLEEERREARPGDACSELLAHSLLGKGPSVFDPQASLERLFARLEWLTSEAPDFCFDLGESQPWSKATEKLLTIKALRSATQYCSSLSAVKKAKLADTIKDSLTHAQKEFLYWEAPEEVKLQGGRRLQVHYEKGRIPWVQSRLQDFFSMEETISLCRGKVKLQLHLLAPNHRAVQVTTDLAGFWSRHYPELRKQLMRRYPRHLWPEDGRVAKPPSPGRIR